MEPIRSIYEDDPDMAELVQSFVTDLSQRVETLEQLLAEGNLQELQRMAHQLKGAGGGYGFPQITDVAATLEQSLKEAADEGTVKERTGALCEVLRAVRAPENG
jgi:HPt (histidine-containing phosphotransfer) domain-containing protein